MEFIDFLILLVLELLKTLVHALLLHDELFADLKLSLQHHSLRCQFFADILVLLTIGLQQINLDLLEHLFGDNVIELSLFQN